MSKTVKRDLEALPARLFEAYTRGRAVKEQLGTLGLFEQNRRNERFYVGDQWHGAKCGAQRPLVRHNVIRRIGEYKIAVLGGSPLTVNYSAEGVARTRESAGISRQARQRFAAGEAQTPMSRNEQINLTVSALSAYFASTAERVKWEDIKSDALKDAYITGTGIVYTYWDPAVKTGLYADGEQTVPITGDIAVETLDVENVTFGDPNRQDVQSQPYILISQRKSVREIRKAGRDAGLSAAQLENIRPDSETGTAAGDRGQTEPEDSRKATLLTCFWKETGEDGEERVWACSAARGQTVREPWNLGIRLYPFAVFRWETRKGSAYGDSEITYLIPNQIAINRMLSASVWAVMSMGIPITLVNGDIVPDPVTNDPGQVLRVFGTAEETANAVRYVNPPAFSPKFDEMIGSLIANTLQQSGANDAALGDVRPDNTSAIIAVREAATMPLQVLQNRFYSFVEDMARIWAEFWVSLYGSRGLKVTDEYGTWYLPFDGAQYRDLVLTAKIDVGAAGLWSESQLIATLDKMFEAGLLTPVQYLERLPGGIVPNLTGLINEMKDAAKSSGEAGVAGDA